MTKNSLLGDSGELAEKMKKIKEQMETTSSIQQPIKGKTETKKNEANPKLFVSGRLDRKKHNYNAKSLTLLAKLEDEIKAYCRGGEIVVLNYLIREGLRKVKESKTVINIDISSMEEDDI